LQILIHDIGIPHALHSDDAKEITQGRFKALCRDYNIPCTQTEPYSPWQNRAEGGIRELKRHVSRKIKSRNVPLKLWDFCSRWSCDVRSKTSSNNFILEGRTPYGAVTGHTPDISSLTDYDFYEPVWYFDELAQFPESKCHIRRWLGEACTIGQAMCYYVLPKNGIPIARSTVQPITEDQKMTDEVKKELRDLDQAIETKLGSFDTTADTDLPNYFQPQGNEDDDESDTETPQFEPI